MRTIGGTDWTARAREAARRVTRSRRAAVGLMTALVLPALLGMAGLVAEYGSGLMAHGKAQRMADVAALSGAVTFNATGSKDRMDAAVSRIATLNGYSSSAVSAALVASPTGNGNQAVQATVTDSVSLSLSKVIQPGTVLPVSATSYAELKPGGAACIIALNGSGTGVQLSGGSKLTASSCAVASNSTLVVPNGTSLTAAKVSYNTTAPDATTLSNIHAPSGGSLSISKKATADPLLNNSAVTGATSRITTVAAMVSPSAPSLTQPAAVHFGWYPTDPFDAAGCHWTFANNAWTGQCTGDGPFNFNLQSDGPAVQIRNTSSTATYNYYSQLVVTSSGVSFPGGTYNLAQGLSISGGASATFGAGTFNIGAPGSCASGYYSVSNQGGAILTVAGPSTFVLSCGLYNAGGSKITLGSGSSGNSYSFGYTTDGGSVAMNLLGGSTTTFGDATSGGLFRMNGTINVANGGGSCLTLPAASAHDINGSITTAGGTIVGSGVYTVNGYVALGGSGGGDVTCNGSTVGMSGSGVTFVVSGASTAGGSCSGAIFCVASGFGHVSLTAPNTGATNSLLVIGPTTSSKTAGATFAEGSAATSLSGVFYVPYGPLTMSGAASVGNGTGQCLELIASQVTQTGGTALASTCSGLGGQTTGGQVVLVR